MQKTSFYVSITLPQPTGAENTESMFKYSFDFIQKDKSRRTQANNKTGKQMSSVAKLKPIQLKQTQLWLSVL